MQQELTLNGAKLEENPRERRSKGCIRRSATHLAQPNLFSPKHYRIKFSARVSLTVCGLTAQHHHAEDRRTGPVRQFRQRNSERNLEKILESRRGAARAKRIAPRSARLCCSCFSWLATAPAAPHSASARPATCRRAHPQPHPFEKPCLVLELNA